MHIVQLMTPKKVSKTFFGKPLHILYWQPMLSHLDPKILHDYHPSKTRVLEHMQGVHKTKLSTRLRILNPFHTKVLIGKG